MGSHWNDLIQREVEVRRRIDMTPPDHPHWPTHQMELTTILAAKAIREAIYGARY